MIALIDGDVLRYEVGAIGNKQGPEDPRPMSFDSVLEHLEQRIAQILYATEADDFEIYLTGSSNFRDEIAVTKPYKGNRKPEKPFHFHNLTVYMHNAYKVRVVEGMEADDLMSVRQLADEDISKTVICTRDKDLRMIPGWHYGWECGKQPELHKHWVTYDGELWEKNGKYYGNGMSFFHFQLLTGDTVDNIPGLYGIGPKTAFALLEGCPIGQQFSEVRALYHKEGMDDEYLLEQGRLLWMTRELDENGGPVLWELPD